MLFALVIRNSITCVKHHKGVYTGGYGRAKGDLILWFNIFCGHYFGWKPQTWTCTWRSKADLYAAAAPRLFPGLLSLGWSVSDGFFGTGHNAPFRVSSFHRSVLVTTVSARQWSLGFAWHYRIRQIVLNRFLTGLTKSAVTPKVGLVLRKYFHLWKATRWKCSSSLEESITKWFSTGKRLFTLMIVLKAVWVTAKYNKHLRLTSLFLNQSAASARPSHWAGYQAADVVRIH